MTDHLKEIWPEPGTGVSPFRPKRGEDAEKALLAIYEVHANYCKDQECMVCGVLACPMFEPLHFHHDGCPADCGT